MRFRGDDEISARHPELDSRSKDKTRWIRRFLREAVWYLIPIVAVTFTGLYITLALIWHVNPPFVPVEGQSMRPFLRTGDLVLLHGVSPAQLKKGDVIAVSVPLADQQKYHIPGEVVHRIDSLSDTPQGGYIFQTKGDANGGPDVFQTPATNVIGLMTGKITYLGYPILFFRSRQGEIFAGVAALVAIGYMLLGWAQRRQEQDPAVELLQMVLAETSTLSAEVGSIIRPGFPAAPRNFESNDNSDQMSRPNDSDKDESQEIYSALPPTGDSLVGLTSAVAASVDMNSTTNESVRELLEAMREYAQHLRSHTAAVEGMSQASMDLARVTSDMRDFIGNLTEVSPRVGATSRQSEAPVVQHVQENIQKGASTYIQDDDSPAKIVPITDTETEDLKEVKVDFADEVRACVQLAVELDLHRIQTIFQKVRRKRPGREVYSSSLKYIVWASAVAWNLVLADKGRSGANNHRHADLILEIETPGVSSAIHQLVINEITVLSPNTFLDQLNSTPKMSTSGISGEAPKLRVVDWSETETLLVLPVSDLADNLTILNVGGIRRSPVVVLDDEGIEGIAVHSVALLTISAPQSYGLNDLRNYLGVLRRLIE